MSHPTYTNWTGLLPANQPRLGYDDINPAILFLFCHCIKPVIVGLGTDLGGRLGTDLGGRGQ